MDELVFLKLGGSLLTDKTRSETLRPVVLSRLAAEVATARVLRPGLKLLIGHGSGSYGHVVANKHGIRVGVSSPEAWQGYAETASVAARLHQLVTDTLWQAGVPVLPIQPSASASCHDGELVALTDRPIVTALEQGLVPVVYGDVALDDVRGGTIVSTEQIFRYLALRLRPQRVLLVGEVQGVLSADPASGVHGDLVEQVTPSRWSEQAQFLGGSRGVDVTGGMLGKVAEMVALVQAMPDLKEVRILSGLVPGLVRQTLVEPNFHAGTRICRDA